VAGPAYLGDLLSITPWNGSTLTRITLSESLTSRPAAGVSERTLRDVFVEYFGMGPLTYIRTWQLHRIRAALLEAEPGQATVTSVAMRLGVWDLDTMAGRYRHLFGERPGVTLRRKGIR